MLDGETMTEGWSTDAYEARNGARAEAGPMAAALRSLDARDPTSPKRDAKRTTEDALRELANYLGDARWCPELKRWVVRGTRDMYALLEDAPMLARIETFFSARLLWALAELERHPDEPRAKAFAKEARKQDTSRTAADMASRLKGRRRAAASDLDRRPDVFGTPTGVAALDGELLAEEDDLEYSAGLTERPEYRALAWNVTKRTRAELASDSFRREFEPDPRWAEFVDEVCDGDGEKAAFLQRALGYSLYGGNPEKATFVLWGPKRDNGKSTLMSAVKHALGDYAGTMEPDELLARRYKNPQAASPGLAALVGKRLVDVPETPLGAELDGALLKRLASGSDELSVRNLNCDKFCYVPQFTLWLHCNTLPVMRDPTAVDPRHMFVVEFTRSFTGEERDPGLAGRFKTDRGMNTVLEWLLAGWRDYAEGGLRPPACVTGPTRRWLDVSKSWLQSFIDERCVLGEDRTCGTGDFRRAAQAYCEECAETFVLGRMKAALKEANVVERKSHGRRIYRGIALRGKGAKTPPEGQSELYPNCPRESLEGADGGREGGGITLA